MQLAPVHRVGLEDPRLAVELDSDVAQDRHQPFAERFELLPRIPDLAHVEIPFGPESVASRAGPPFPVNPVLPLPPM